MVFPQGTASRGLDSTAELCQCRLQASQTTHALVVDENLGHLTNRRSAFFIKRHAFGLAIDLDFFKIKRFGFEHHLGGFALGACGLGVNDDFEVHGAMNGGKVLADASSFESAKG
jgi:hypothetical protein